MLLGRIIMGWDLFSFLLDVIFHSELLVFYSFLSLEVKRLWAAELIQKVVAHILSSCSGNYFYLIG